MKTLDLLKQLEINYKLISNDLEYSSHALDSFLKAAARYVFRFVMVLPTYYFVRHLISSFKFTNGQNTTAVAGPQTPTHQVQQSDTI